ncbi:Germ cell-less protein-like 1, partial [Stegodyphus mimosarum]
MPFLSTNCGCPYQKAFRALRLKHLVVHHVDMEVIESDNIIPVDWFMPIFKIQWYQMLRVEQGADKGPNQVSDEEFMKDCVRCGRVLNTDTQHSWRWTGFNFGFDIVIFYARGTFKLRRYLKTENEMRPGQNPYDSLSLRSEKRHLMYRFGVFSLNKDGKIISKNETSIKTVSLTENEQVTVLNFQTEMKFPLLISANFLLTTPLQSNDEIMPSIRHTSEGYV